MPRDYLTPDEQHRALRHAYALALAILTAAAANLWQIARHEHTTAHQVDENRREAERRDELLGLRIDALRDQIALLALACHQDTPQTLKPHATLPQDQRSPPTPYHSTPLFSEAAMLIGSNAPLTTPPGIPRIRTVHPGVPGTAIHSIWYCSTPGSSGTTDPTTHDDPIGSTRHDGTVTWTITGQAQGLTLPLWQASHPYTLGDQIQSTGPKTKTKTTSTTQPGPKQKAPGPGEYANPDPYPGHSYDTFDGKHRSHIFAAQLRRDYQAWLAHIWKDGTINQSWWTPPYACDDYGNGPPTCENIFGDLYDMGAWELFVHTNGPYLMPNLHQILSGAATTFASYYDFPNCYPADDDPPTILSATVPTTGQISITWTHPDDSDKTYAYLYCTPPHHSLTQASRRALMLIGANFVPGPFGTPHTSLSDPSPFRRLKTGQQILVGLKLSGTYGYLTRMALFPTVVQ